MASARQLRAVCVCQPKDSADEKDQPKGSGDVARCPCGVDAAAPYVVDLRPLDSFGTAPARPAQPRRALTCSGTQ
jgi:hypothetical protein